jgi:hypothetical protein
VTTRVIKQSTSHTGIYEINNKVSKIIGRTKMYTNEQSCTQINMENVQQVSVEQSTYISQNTIMYIIETITNYFF